MTSSDNLFPPGYLLPYHSPDGSVPSGWERTELPVPVELGEEEILTSIEPTDTLFIVRKL